MRSSRPAMQSRHSGEDHRGSIVEYAVMITLIAVLVIATALLMVTKLGQ